MTESLELKVPYNRIPKQDNTTEFKSRILLSCIVKNIEINAHQGRA